MHFHKANFSQSAGGIAVSLQHQLRLTLIEWEQENLFAAVYLENTSSQSSKSVDEVFLPEEGQFYGLGLRDPPPLDSMYAYSAVRSIDSISCAFSRCRNTARTVNRLLIVLSEASGARCKATGNSVAFSVQLAAETDGRLTARTGADVLEGFAVANKTAAEMKKSDHTEEHAMSSSVMPEAEEYEAITRTVCERCGRTIPQEAPSHLRLDIATL